jgi:hypothetical protein
MFGMCLVLAAACGRKDDSRETSLVNLRTNQKSPEEFSILPVKPLQMPESLNELPQPVRGAPNRTDPTPNADAVAALGGNPAALVPGGVPVADSPLLAHAGRFGTDPAIRTELADADYEFRKRRSLFTWRLFPQDEYARAYRRFALDPYAELERFRRLGVRTPSAPPGG